MLFTSYQFILFVLIALILYYVAPKRIQWIVLLCMNMSVSYTHLPSPRDVEESRMPSSA